MTGSCANTFGSTCAAAPPPSAAGTQPAPEASVGLARVTLQPATDISTAPKTTAATSAAARTKINKQIETLRKQQAELLAFDEKLRHYADMRITLDLDDGVKVNYGKFGDLLAEVKAVTGEK